jgi:hypothetical protein
MIARHNSRAGVSTLQQEFYQANVHAALQFLLFPVTLPAMGFQDWSYIDLILNRIIKCVCGGSRQCHHQAEKRCPCSDHDVVPLSKSGRRDERAELAGGPSTLLDELVVATTDLPALPDFTHSTARFIPGNCLRTIPNAKSFLLPVFRFFCRKIFCGRCFCFSRKASIGFRDSIWWLDEAYSGVP